MNRTAFRLSIVRFDSGNPIKKKKQINAIYQTLIEVQYQSYNIMSICYNTLDTPARTHSRRNR